MSGGTKQEDVRTDEQRALAGAFANAITPLLGGPGGFFGQNNPFRQFISQETPESRANAFLAGPLQDLIQRFSTAGFADFEKAATDRSNRQLQFGLGQLGAAAPSARGSALGLQGVDLATRSNEALQLFLHNAELQRVQPVLAASQLFGSLAGQEGAAGRSELSGLLIQPTLGLLGLGTSIATGTPAMQTQIQPSFFGGAAQGGALGAAAAGASKGAIGGPVGAGIGAGLGALGALTAK